MIIVTFAVTAFLIGAILGLRFKGLCADRCGLSQFYSNRWLRFAARKKSGVHFSCRILRRNGNGIRLPYRSNYWLFLRARLRRFRRLPGRRCGYTADIPTSSAGRQGWNLGNIARRDCDAVLTNAIFVDIDTESGAVETIGVALGGRDWRNGDILRQPRMCQRQSPADIGNDGGDMSCGRAGDARFAGFA